MNAKACLPFITLGFLAIGCQNNNDITVPEDAAPPTVTTTTTTTTTVTDTSTPTATTTSTPTATTTSTPTVTDTSTTTVTDTSTTTLSSTTTTTETATDTTVTTSTDTSTATSTFSYTAPDLTTFCTGGAARMMVNGVDATPTVKGKVVPYDCCRGGQFELTSASLAQPISVWWQAQTSAFSGVSKVDLAKPPTGWTVAVETGCSSLASCSDSYTSGLTGSLAISIGKSAMYDMSLCLHVQETVDSPRPTLHALDLFVPRVGAN